MLDVRTVVPFVAVIALGACSRGGQPGTMPPPEAAAPPPTSSQQTEARPETITVSEEDLRANDLDLQRMEAIGGEIDAEAQAYLQTVQAAQQAVDDLSVAAVDHHVPPSRLDAMVTRAIQEGNTQPDRRFGKDQAVKEQVRSNLEILHTFADAVTGAQNDVVRHEDAIARLRAEAHDLWTKVQERSEATTPPGEQMHPEVQEDLEKGRHLIGDVDDKATAARQDLQESLSQEQQLATALGIDLGASEEMMAGGAGTNPAGTQSKKKPHRADMSAAAALGKPKQGAAERRRPRTVRTVTAAN